MNKISYTTFDSTQKKRMPSLVSGFTLIEVLFSIAILVLLSTIILSALRLLSGREKISTEAKKVIVAIEEARAKTISGEGGQRFGVYIMPNQLIIYEHPYLENNPNNKVLYLEGGISISSYTISGGGNQILFNKISGETNNDGTITLLSKSGDTKQINVQKTGSVYAIE
ncbi:MAG: type II secretion system protein [Patescibacteria group bacterium]